MTPPYDLPGATMPVSLSIKNVPESLLEKLRARADQNHRSLQGELMAILEIAAAETPRLTVAEAASLLAEEVPPSPSESTSSIRRWRDGHDR